MYVHPLSQSAAHNHTVQQHLIFFPIISDSVTTFRANPYGAKCLALTSAGIERFGKPLLSYLSKSYQYVSPYVQMADALGDSTLSILESRFPAVKKPTGELYNEIIFFPLNKGSKGKNYMLSVFGKEKKAVELLEHVVRVRETTLAEDHPDRLTSQHELAIAYQTDGQVKKAVELLEHVVRVRETTLAEDHPYLLGSQHALLRLYRDYKPYSRRYVLRKEE
jgi:hypothetical protein